MVFSFSAQYLISGSSSFIVIRPHEVWIDELLPQVLPWAITAKWPVTIFGCFPFMHNTWYIHDMLEVHLYSNSPEWSLMGCFHKFRVPSGHLPDAFLFRTMLETRYAGRWDEYVTTFVMFSDFLNKLIGFDVYGQLVSTGGNCHTILRAWVFS